jgi:AraC family transcriptional regulator
VIDSLDDPSADGARLAERASFSRDHLDRLLAAATGETPVGLRRRLLLERAAWQLRSGVATAAEAGAAAGYGSPEAFSRAFSRAYGSAPGTFGRSQAPVELDSPNGIHFHAPAGLLIPGAPVPSPGFDLSERLVRHHVDRVRELLAAAAGFAPDQLARRLRPGLVVVWFEGPEETAELMVRRLVHTLEVWTAAVEGDPPPEDRAGDLPARFEAVAVRFERWAKRVRDRGAWNDAFVDALCEPPQSFTYGGVLAHILTYGAVRREALAGVLTELGAGLSSADPIMWEMGR